MREGELLEIIKVHKRNLLSAAQEVVFEHFLAKPVDELPTQDLEEMENIANTISKRLGKLCNNFELV